MYRHKKRPPKADGLFGSQANQTENDSHPYYSTYGMKNQVLRFCSTFRT